MPRSGVTRESASPKLEAALRKSIRSLPDYPKKGVTFRDITPLLKDPELYRGIAEEIAAHFAKDKVDYVAGIESRGFPFGALVAEQLNVGFVLIRKKGKLPYETVSVDYGMEYGTATIEMHSDAVEKGSRVLIVDDLLATGGTAKASFDLVKKLKAKVVGYAFVVELVDLKGREKLEPSEVFSLVKYD
jgi:adenine phosphoribosyltransferase